jgi:ech hydrogenase subunit A
MEKLAPSISFSLFVLLIGVLVTGIGIAPMYNSLIDPQFKAMAATSSMVLQGGSDGGIWLVAKNGAVVGGFAVLAVFAILGALLVLMLYYFRKTKLDDVRTPYLCGENINADIRGLQFTGPGEKAADVVVRNYYFHGIFGEDKLTVVLNLAAGAIILLMFGVVLR